MLPEKENKENEQNCKNARIGSRIVFFEFYNFKTGKRNVHCPCIWLGFLKNSEELYVCMYLYCETFWQDPFDKLLHNGSKSFIWPKYNFIIMFNSSETFVAASAIITLIRNCSMVKYKKISKSSLDSISSPSPSMKSQIMGRKVCLNA